MNVPNLDQLLAQANYPNNSKFRVKQDILQLVQQVRTLRPQMGRLVKDNRPINLVVLDGTVPINFQGSNFNIPVNIFLPFHYPATPPECFVTPTKNMRIKERHKHVAAADGKVYLPELSAWNQNTSRLPALVAVMSAVFSEDPPCFAVANQPPQQQARPYVMPNPHNRPVQQRPVQQPPHYNSNPRQPAPIPVAQPAQNSRAALKTNLVQQATVMISSRLRNNQQSAQADYDKLFELQSSLEEGAKQLQATQAAFAQEQADLVAASTQLDQQTASLTQWLAENETKQEINANEAIYFKDSWSKQLFDLVAEDHAIEDTMYCLDTLLADEKCDLKQFLKEIRKLARKQFMARALAKKVVSKQREAGMHNQEPGAPANANAMQQQPGAGQQFMQPGQPLML